jgi:Domain of unknown function (DUF4407)
MAMAKHYLLARLGGADARMLADEEIASQTGERTRFVAMGGVLLTTAGVATLSMFFALHHAVGVSTGWSIPFALAWGVVIINIDRFLIITLTSSRGHPVRLTVTVLVRLVLAGLISIVVATPLVLQVFASDIDAELPIIQQQQSTAFGKNIPNTADGRQLATYEQQIKTAQNVIDAKGTGDQAIVDNLTAQATADKEAASRAALKWKCEIGGLEGAICQSETSGLIGNGPLAQADQLAYNNDVQIYTNINNQLTAARNTLSSDTNALMSLKTKAANLQTKINGKTASDDNKNALDTGLLEQIHALFAASDSDSALAWAHWIVTALFFVIEALPVTVKCLLLLGDETPYEKIVKNRGEAAVGQADVTLDAEMYVMQTRAQSMREIAELEAQSRHDIRETTLQSDRVIAHDKEQARQGVETDLTRREKGTRIEANKRFASATRDHILAAIDDWALQIREAIRLGSRPHGANGGAPHSTGPNPSGSNGQNTSGNNGPNGGI